MGGCDFARRARTGSGLFAGSGVQGGLFTSDATLLLSAQLREKVAAEGGRSLPRG